MGSEALTAAIGILGGGADTDDAVASLVRRGIDRDTAALAVERAADELEAERLRSEARRRPLAAAFVAGVLAALATGIGWAWLFVHTGDRLGALAWLIGVVAGAVVVGVGRRRGRRPQLIAVGCAAVGFLLGKYLTFALPLHDLTRGRVDVLSFEAERTFASGTGAWGPGDAVYGLLALWGAWGIARVPRPKRRSIV